MNRSVSKATLSAIVVTALSIGSTTVHAQPASENDVRASLSSREAYVGVPITLRIEVESATTSTLPEIPSVDGLQIESLGAPSHSSQTTIINGHRTDRTSVTFSWRVTPRQAGRFVIPSVEVPVNGDLQRTRPLTFVATKSEIGDLLFAEVDGTRSSVYVGQALPVTLRIWVKPYRDPDLGITLSEADMWQFVSNDLSSLGVFGERLAENRERPSGREVLRADSQGDEHSYYLYEVETSFYPKRPGAIDVGNVQVVVSYPTGLGRSRDLFSMFDRRLSVTGTRPIVAEADVAAIEVKPLPTADRPADFRGAVGQYEIATHAMPTQVQAGDPITLQIGIRGDGPLDLVQAPPMSALPQLTADFRVPDESLAGIVENGIKVFTVSLRPRREGITQIPSIPFTYFDPKRDEYVTAHSNAIPIQVSAAETLSLSTIGGVSPNAEVTDEQAADSVLSIENATGSELLASQSPGSWRSVVIFACLGPLAFALAWCMKHIGWSKSGLMKLRLRRPAAVALKAVAAAGSPREVSAALLTLVADRLQRPAAALTRKEAVAGLRSQIKGEHVAALDDLLARCEWSTYAPSSTKDLSELKADAQQWLTTASDCNRSLSL